jgi:probable HAF family extracellular repeat protein
MESPSNHRGPLVKPILKTRRALRMLSVVFLTASAAIGLTGGTAAQAGTQTYSITDLGTLGSNTAVGYGINANAQIVGRSYLQQTVPATGCGNRVVTCVAHVFHAFRYSAGTMTDLGTLGGTFSDARAVNSNGDVAGSSSLSGTALNPTNAFLYHNGHMTDLGTLGGGNSTAYGINSLGEVVGESSTASGQNDAFLSSGGHDDRGHA